MSVYLEKGRGWKYDFVLKRQRHQKGYFKTKREAQRAEAERKEEIRNPPTPEEMEAIPTDMAFLELVNRRLDHVKAYNSASHYEEYIHMARKWVRRWGKPSCGEITQRMIEGFVLERSRVSAYTANKEIRYLKATFNYGLKKGLIGNNPVIGLDFLPVNKQRKYVPPLEDIVKVIECAGPETQDYLWTIRDTMARMSEVNNLTWDDVDLTARTITLYTRKKRGGHRTPRTIPMTSRLYGIMSRRFETRDKKKPWVFWRRHWDRKNKCWHEGPYHKRQHLMAKLCKRAGVRPFGFHAIRHAGASLLDQQRIPLCTIQKILGHENRTTTEIYLHNLEGAEREAMEVFEKASAVREAGFQEKSLSKSLSDGSQRLRLKLVKG